jgi:hypothetical protein
MSYLGESDSFRILALIRLGFRRKISVTVSLDIVTDRSVLCIRCFPVLLVISFSHLILEGASAYIRLAMYHYSFW